MTNWAGAVETLGKGLFAVGMKVTQREDDEIAFMRQKALQELGIQAQKDLQAQNQKFLGEMEDKRQTFEGEQFARETAARAGEQQRGFDFQRELNEDNKKWDLRRDADMRAFQLKIRETDSLDDIIRSTNSQLADIGKSIDSWEQELMAARREGAEPSVIESYQRRIDALYSQQEQVRSAGQAAVSRATGGKPVQPGPTKEAAASLGTSPPTEAAPTKPAGPPAGAYTGGASAQAAPAAQQPGGSVFDSLFEPTPGGTAEINRRIVQWAGGKAGNVLFDPSSPTGQVNRDIYNRIFGK